MAKLKVFVFPTGFHDAYVAAPSRKAALAAWGSDHDLFARGVAHEVTDATLTAEPLAHPGTVIRRSRGTTEEQIAALPADAQPAVKRGENAKEGKGQSPRPAKPAKIAPRPSRDRLDAAEAALDEARKHHRAVERDIAERQAALDRERRDTARAAAKESTDLAAKADTERKKYDRAMERWRG